MSEILLGGPGCRGHKVKGDLVVFFQYINGEEAMAITPRNPKIKKGAYVICLSSAFKYVDSDTGGPTPYLFEQAATAIDVLGMERSSHLIYRIADLICECLPELVNMKPERLDPDPDGLKPPGEAAAVKGVGLVTVDGQEHEFDLSKFSAAADSQSH